MVKQSLVYRKEGDLLRTSNGVHCKVKSVNLKKNTCTIEMLKSGKVEESVSWWDLKMPDDETVKMK